MKVRNLAALLVLAVSLPIAIQGSALAQENLVPSNGVTGTDTQANIDAAKDRLDKARVKFEIAQKQVDAAKARLKAADAEFKAAKANFEARNLDHQAKKLSDASGLPEISEGQIEQSRTKSLALKEVENVKQPAPQAPVDLSKTRLKQVDFNAQPEEMAPVAPSAPPADITPQAAPQTDAPAPDKQAIVEPTYQAAPPQVAATSSSTVTEQPPIVP